MGKYDYILSQKVHNRIYGFYSLKGGDIAKLCAPLFLA